MPFAAATWRWRLCCLTRARVSSIASAGDAQVDLLCVRANVSARSWTPLGLALKELVPGSLDMLTLLLERGMHRREGVACNVC